MEDKTYVVKIQYDTEDAVKRVEDLSKAIIANKANQKELDERLKAGKISQVDYATKMAETTHTLNRDTHERKKYINVLQAEIGSVKRAKAETQVWREERNKLGDATGKNKKQIEDLNAKINAHTKLIGDTVDKQSQWYLGVNQANLSLGEMKKALIALKQTSFEGKSAEEIQALKLKIGQLTDAMGDAQSEMKMMGTENAAVLVGGLKFIAASVEGVVGTLSLFGVESETVKNLEKKMTSLIAVTQALAEIEDTISSGKLRAIALRIKDMALTAKDSVIKWANSTATIAQSNAEKAKMVITGKASIATKAAAAVQWLWNAALAANPIGLIIVGVAALVAGITALVFVMKKNNDEIDRQKKAYEALSLANETIIRNEERKLEILKIRGLEGTKLLKTELELMYLKHRANMDEIDALLKIRTENKKQAKEKNAQIKSIKDADFILGQEILLQEERVNKSSLDDVNKTNDEKDKLLKEERDNKLAIFIQEGKDFKANQEESVKVQETNKARREKADEEERAAKLAAFVKEGEDFKTEQQNIADEDAKRIADREQRHKEADKRIADKNKKKADEEIALEEQKQAAIHSIVKQTSDTIFSIQELRLSQEMDALDVYYQSRIESESNLGKNTEKLEREYAIKKYEIQVKEFKLSQQKALADIAIAAAVNSVETPALTGFYIAMAALQAGIVLAQKAPAMPAYAEGTEDAARTFLAGEAGMELMKLAGGGYELATKPKIYSGSKYEHAEIFPHDETQQILAANQMNGISMAGVERKLDSINKTVKESRAVVNIINKHDYRYAKRYERMGR